MFLGQQSESQRLDTLEELSEPASSDYWQLDSIGSKGSGATAAVNTIGEFSKITGTLFLLPAVRYLVYITSNTKFPHF